MPDNKKKKQRDERVVETKDGRRFRVSEDAELPDERVTVLAGAIAKELKRLDEEPEKKEKPKQPRSLLDAFLGGRADEHSEDEESEEAEVEAE